MDILANKEIFLKICLEDGQLIALHNSRSEFIECDMNEIKKKYGEYMVIKLSIIVGMTEDVLYDYKTKYDKKLTKEQIESLESWSVMRYNSIIDV